MTILLRPSNLRNPELTAMRIDSKMNPQSRRAHIRTLVAKRGTCSVGELARELGVSGMTVRRDLESLAEDGRTAWFDEALDSASYGECRGSGALQLYQDGWKIEQYNLTIPIPNEIAKQVVEDIRALMQSDDP